jgi:hypothetical protein
MITKTQRDHKASIKTRPKISHSQPNHLIERESHTTYNRMFGYHDSCTLYKGSALYQRVVISSLIGWLGNLPFAILYTSFGVWPRDHYMSLQWSTTGVCHTLLWFSKQTVPACSAKVSYTNVPSCTMWFRRFTNYDEKYIIKYDAISHSTE